MNRRERDEHAWRMDDGGSIPEKMPDAPDLWRPADPDASEWRSHRQRGAAFERAVALLHAASERREPRSQQVALERAASIHADRAARDRGGPGPRQDTAQEPRQGEGPGQDAAQAPGQEEDLGQDATGGPGHHGDVPETSWPGRDE